VNEGKGRNKWTVERGPGIGEKGIKTALLTAGQIGRGLDERQVRSGTD